MGGQIDWAALPVIVELYGVEDVDLFIAKLDAIREHKRMIDNNG
jgi:hypothetical protein